MTAQRTQLIATVEKPQTLVDLARWRAASHPNRRAYTFLTDGEKEGANLTYYELDQRARTIAASLQLHTAPGERALLVYQPGLDFVVAFFGCLYAGIVAVPVYPPNTARLNHSLERLHGIIQNARPALALTSSTVLSGIPDWFVNNKKPGAPKWLATDNCDLLPARTWKAPDIDKDTVAFLQYTSGSTGEPRGVIVSYGNLLENENLIEEIFHHDGQSVVVSWLPLYHDMGLIGNMLHPMYVGAPCILMSPISFVLQPSRWLQAISKYRGVISGGPNFAYELCVNRINPNTLSGIDLSSWTVAFNGSEPVSHQTLQRFAAVFERFGFRPSALYPCYGLAEATLLVSGGGKRSGPVSLKVDAAALEQDRVVVTNNSSKHLRTLVGCGRAWHKQEILIVDPVSRIQCQPDQVGEVWIYSPSIAIGYWNRPEETTRVFNAYLAETGKGPYLRTGDLGFIKDGELYVTGRSKDLIIIDGRNHYPHDIEQTVEKSHPAIRAGGCAAVSVDINEQEHLIIIAEIERSFVMENRPASANNPEAKNNDALNSVTNAIRRHVSAIHDLRASEILLIKSGTIPRTSSGKLQRHLCRAGFLNNSLKTI